MATGKVYLVGAGPGDPGLVTLRAARVLGRADAVLYDYLVNPAILRHCRPEAERISLGRHGRGRILSQVEINQRLVELATSGKTVVRLKSGDPLVFARAGEELDCLVRNGIPFEIVPGVTAVLAAASYAGIPVTHRELASALALVTGREGEVREGETPAELNAETSLDYSALARFPGTLAFYMGVTTVGHWSAELLAGGKPPATPVAILRHVSLPDQRRIDTTLGQVATVVKENNLRPPVVFIVGEVAAHGTAWSWFEKRPLFGMRVLVSRPIDQAAALTEPLTELGAEVLVQPAIVIRPPADWSAVDAAIARLDQFEWLVFSSSNGVRHLLDRLLALGLDLRKLGHIRIAAIGPGTADELARYHLRADLVPDEFRAESLAAALAGGAAGRRFLLLRASRGRELLAEELAKAGGHIEQVVVYESTDVATPDPDIAARLAAGQIDWTTVTSSAIARSLVRLFGESLKKTKLVSISPITSATLRELGYEPATEAREYTMAGLVQAIPASDCS